MQAVLGASASVASLLLVLQGFLLTTLGRFGITDDPRVKSRYKRTIGGIAVPVALSILVGLGATASLLGLDLFWATVAGFCLSLLLLLAASIVVVVLALQ